MTTLDEFSDECDCAALPDGWPCADCYIKNGEEINE